MTCPLTQRGRTKSRQRRALVRAISLIRLRWSRWSIENGDTKAIACAAAAKSELEHDLCRSLVAICQTLGTAPAMSNSKRIPAHRWRPAGNGVQLWSADPFEPEPPLNLR